MRKILKSFEFFVVCMVLLMGFFGLLLSPGCTTMKITAPIKLPDGTTVNAVVQVSRPPFASADLAYNPVTGFLTFGADQSAQFNQNLINLNNLALTAASIYGGLPTAKTAATATPAVTTTEANPAEK